MSNEIFCGNQVVSVSGYNSYFSHVVRYYEIVGTCLAHKLSANEGGEV